MVIKLNTIIDVQDFVELCNCKKYLYNNIDVKQGRQVIDGRSILGIYSLNLLKPLDVVIDYGKYESDFYSNIKKWKVDR